MRKLIFLFALILSFAASGQVISEPNRLFPKQNFAPPKDTTFPAIKVGEIRHNASSSQYFWWNGLMWKALIDTSVLSTKANVQQIVNDSSAVLRTLASTPDGVTSVSAGTGLSGGTISSTGTISADTTALSTRANAQKVVNDSSRVLRTLAGNTTPRFSSLTGATGSNAINNGGFYQQWYWETLSTGALALLSSSTSGSNGNSLLYVQRTGAQPSIQSTAVEANASTTGSGAENRGLFARAVGSGAATNVAGYFNAANATTNYGIRVEGGISDFNGAMNLKQVSKTATYTADATDYTIFCNATSGAITINLPSAATSGVSGRVYVIKKTDNSANAVIVDGNAAETIDGAATYSLSTQYKYVTIQSNGANWFVIGNN